MKRILLSAISFLLAVLVSLVVFESLFRVALRIDSPVFARLRDPSLFADYFSDDDYWKLHYRFGGSELPPQNPDPVLGWVSSNFKRGTYRHRAAPQLSGRRPVLLYGDSFASCATLPAECFQGVINAEDSFSRSHFLLNYGVGGYGVDQMYLLIQATLDHYRDPVVIVAIMTDDLDRSILSVRGGQKPVFDLVGEDLRLREPIDPVPSHFFQTHPPQIVSYLWRFLGVRRLIPSSISNYWSDEEKVARKRAVNRGILSAIVEETRSREIDSLFVIFNSLMELREPSWREPFLRSTLTDLGAEFLTTREIIENDLHSRGLEFDADHYFDATQHPTAAQNRLVSDAILDRLALPDAVEPSKTPVRPGQRRCRFPGRGIGKEVSESPKVRDHPASEERQHR